MLLCLQSASHTWVPPLEYPIPDDPDDRWSVATGNFTSDVFVLVVSVLCVLLFPLA